MGYNMQQQANEFSRQRHEIIKEWESHQNSEECYQENCKKCKNFQLELSQLENREKEFWETSN